MPAPVVLLTDFGTKDVYVGVMKGVIAGIAPGAAVIDLSHEIRRQDIRAGACALLFSYRYFPPGSVFCCVVDPGVGTAREAVALELETPLGRLHVVCPDNGLITPLRELVRRAAVLDNPAYHLPAVSATFHGRDIFAPTAAHLANGVPLELLGSHKEPSGLATVEWPVTDRDGETWRASVIHVDNFGNLITNLSGRLLADEPAPRVRIGTRTIERISPTFGAVAVGEAVAYIGSSGNLELAVRQGSAATEWGAGVGDEVLVTRNP